MKFNIKYGVLSLLAFTTLLISCKDDDNLPMTSQAFITTSCGFKSEIVQVNSFITFVDLSTHVVSRKWEFPNNTFDINKIPISNSTDQWVKVSFSEPGEYQVKLSQTFQENVYLKDKGLTDSKNNVDIRTVLVLDSVRARFSAIYGKDNSPIMMKDNGLFEVEAGNTIDFVSNATGSPTDMIWSVIDSKGNVREFKSDDGKASFKFSATGEYNVKFYVKNNFASDVVEYKKAIKVVPSTEPLVLEKVQRNTIDEIGLVFGRAMMDATGSNDAFSVVVKDIKGNRRTPNIISVSTSDNIINLKLNNNIYSDEDITVSYDASKFKLSTLDHMDATSFDNAKLTDFKIYNILASAKWDVGFEKSSVSDWPDAIWEGYDSYKFSIVSTDFHSGNKSAYVDIDVDGGMVITNNNYFTVKADTKYVVGFWIKAVAIGDNTKTPSDIRFYWNKSTDWNATGVVISSSDIGKWVYKSMIVTSKVAESNSFTIRGCNKGSTKPFKFFIDDLTLYEY